MCVQRQDNAKCVVLLTLECLQYGSVKGSDRNKRAEAHRDEGMYIVDIE